MKKVFAPVIASAALLAGACAHETDSQSKAPETDTTFNIVCDPYVTDTTALVLKDGSVIDCGAAFGNPSDPNTNSGPNTSDRYVPGPEIDPKVEAERKKDLDQLTKDVESVVAKANNEDNRAILDLIKSSGLAMPKSNNIQVLKSPTGPELFIVPLHASDAKESEIAKGLIDDKVIVSSGHDPESVTVITDDVAEVTPMIRAISLMGEVSYVAVVHSGNIDPSNKQDAAWLEVGSTRLQGELMEAVGGKDFRDYITMVANNYAKQINDEHPGLQDMAPVAGPIQSPDDVMDKLFGKSRSETETNKRHSIFEQYAFFRALEIKYGKGEVAVQKAVEWMLELMDSGKAIPA